MTSEKKTQWFDLNDIELTKDEVEDEVLEAVKEGKEKVEEVIEPAPEPSPEPQPEPKKERKADIHMIRSLRRADRVYNRTCAKCLRRLPKATAFYRDTDEICIECRGK